MDIAERQRRVISVEVLRELKGFLARRIQVPDWGRPGPVRKTVRLFCQPGPPGVHTAVIGLLIDGLAGIAVEGRQLAIPGCLFRSFPDRAIVRLGRLDRARCLTWRFRPRPVNLGDIVRQAARRFVFRRRRRPGIFRAQVGFVRMSGLLPGACRIWFCRARLLAGDDAAQANGIAAFLHERPVTAIRAGPVGLQRLIQIERKTATAMRAIQANLCHGILLKRMD